MVGLQTLDLPIEVRILCPQPQNTSTLQTIQGVLFLNYFLEPFT